MKNIDCMEQDQINNRLIYAKPTRIGDFNVTTETEFEIFAETPIPSTTLTDVLVDYKLRYIGIFTFLDGFTVLDMNNGVKIDKLSKN